jgi:hypothetical protein
VPTRSARARTCAAVALVLGIGLASGCSLIKDPDAADATSTGLRATDGSAPMTATEPASLPTAFLDEDAIAFPEEDVLNAATGDDVVLTQTKSVITARSLPDLETTYELTSSDGKFTDLRVDAAHGEGYSLEVQTDSGDGTDVGLDQYTLQRFDLDTGEITQAAIATIAQDPFSSANDATAGIADIEGDVVVVDSWVPDSQGPHTTLALDLASESLAWRARPALFLAATPGLVVLDTGTPDTIGRVEAREIGSGLRRWSALPGTLGASGIGTTDDSVLIARDDNVFPDASVARLDLKTGKTVGQPRTTDTWEWTCTGTSVAVAVCSLADGLRSDSDRLVGWDLERDKPAWKLPTRTRFAPAVSLVAHDLIWGELDSGQGVVLDAITGADVAGDTGAGPVAVNDYGGVILYSDRALFLPSGVFEQTESAKPSPSAIVP